MIQRKQTIFLLLATLCGALTFFFPIETFTQDVRSFIFSTSGLFQADGQPIVDASPKLPFSFLFAFFSLVMLVAIMLFKDRKRQLLVVRTANLLLIGTTVFLFITSNSVRAYLEQGGRVNSQFGPSALLPLAMIVFAFLAERAILKDEALVRSADRLR
ncbi:MAG: DUF4293 domain-containing protein [Flavobacteriales bacterium]